MFSNFLIVDSFKVAEMFTLVFSTLAFSLAQEADWKSKK